MNRETQTLFTELFPIRHEALPHLTTYRLEIEQADLNTVAGKLAYRAMKNFGGHWVSTCGRLLTDAPQDEAHIDELVQQLWSQQPATFRELRRVIEDREWRPPPQALADFVARGLMRDVEPEIRRVLAAAEQDLGAVRVERVYDSRGWVVAGEPAVSMSIHSRQILKQDLCSYAGTVKEPHELVDLMVAAKNSTLKGVITGERCATTARGCLP